MQKVSLKGEMQDLGGIREWRQAKSARTLGYEDNWDRWKEQKNNTGCYTWECLRTGLWHVEIWGSLKHLASQSGSGL